MKSTTGTVKWFNDKKGYGFIDQDSGVRDIFVHWSAITHEGMKTLMEGDSVSFELGSGSNGAPQAFDVKVVTRERTLQVDTRFYTARKHADPSGSHTRQDIVPDAEIAVAGLEAVTVPLVLMGADENVVMEVQRVISLQQVILTFQHKAVMNVQLPKPLDRRPGSLKGVIKEIGHVDIGDLVRSGLLIQANLSGVPALNESVHNGQPVKINSFAVGRSKASRTHVG